MQEDISLSNMRETAVKSHAEGKKHASHVKVCQRTDSVSDLFKKKEVSTEKCSSEKSGEHQVDMLSIERQNRNQVN